MTLHATVALVLAGALAACGREPAKSPGDLARTAAAVEQPPAAPALPDVGRAVDSDAVVRSPAREAASSLQVSASDSGCRWIRSTNRRFDVVSTSAGRVIVRQTATMQGCGNAEKVPSELLAEVFDVSAAPEAPARLLLRAPGDAVTFEYYNILGITDGGCCGSGSLTSYFSLLSGKPLLQSSAPLVEVDVPNSRPPLRRYFAFHDGMSVQPAPEEREGDAFLGTLQYGGDQESAQRVAFSGPSGGYRVDSLLVAIGDSVSHGGATDLWAANGSNDPLALTGFSVMVFLSLAQGDGPDQLRITVPVVRDRLVPGRARFSDNARVRVLKPVGAR